MSTIIIYPAGAGGQWLKHLIYCLENNLSANSSTLNYHSEPQSSSIDIHHASIINRAFKPVTTTYKNSDLNQFEKVAFNQKLELDKKIGDRTAHNYYWFNGLALFNMYLNASKKVVRPVTELSLTDQFELMTCDASSKLSDYLNQPIDLDYNLIYTNTEKFITDLYTILDKENITYHQNDNLIIDGINKFKETCIDPSEHFNNFESDMWLAWCMGIIKYQGHQWIMINSIADAQEFLYNNRQMFCDFTLDKFIA